MKIQYVETRYTPEGVPERDPFQPEKTLHNHGSMTFCAEPGTKKTTTVLPGDVFVIDDEMGRALLRRYPHIFMEHNAWLSLMERLNRVKPNREKQREEHQRMLQQREAEAQAADRVRAMVAERDENMRKAAQANAEAAEARAGHDKATQQSAALTERLEQVLAEMQQQRAAAEAARVEQAARIADLEAKLQQRSGGKGKRPADSEPVEP